MLFLLLIVGDKQSHHALREFIKKKSFIFLFSIFSEICTWDPNLKIKNILYL